MNQSPYKALPGPKGIFSLSFNNSRLGLGEDHIILVKSSSGYTESYRRFYFKDIKAITIARTRRGIAINVVLGTLSVLFAFGLMGSNLEFRILSGMLLAFALVPLITNIIKGPTCKTRLITAVQNEELPPMKRLHSTEKTLAILMPVIQSAQESEVAADVPVSQSDSGELRDPEAFSTLANPDDLSET